MMHVLILAGGEGRRMRPFTLTTPKALLPLATRPALEHLFQDLAEQGFRDVIVSGKQDLESAYQACKGDLPKSLKIHFVKEASDPISSIKNAWTNSTQPLLVIPVDVILGQPSTYTKIAETLLTASGKSEKIFAAATTTGIIALHPSAKHFLNKVGDLDDLLPPFEKNIVYVDNGLRAPLVGTNTFRDPWNRQAQVGWVDMDRPHDLLDAHYVILSRMVQKLGKTSISKSAKIPKTVFIKGNVSIGSDVKIAEDVKIGEHVWIGKRTRIDRGATIGSYTVIGDDVKIGADAKVYGVIGNNSQVGRGAEFGGMIMEYVGFPHTSHLAGIVGNHCNISVGIVTGTKKLMNPPFRMFIQGKAEKTHLAGVAIGDHSFIGAGALLMGGSKIGPYSVVGPGVTVYRDVPPNKMVMRKEEVLWTDIHQDHTIPYDSKDYSPLWDRWP
jgi:UDP-N-acetylglucosamine diphosphorylase / glucose-1-phosphate thymidylyltransferase / UDP-N-acetylgalactosamine diphosphorylase / glucosamine-1-phosphate N-acetyltransferase / galactosamine-1-phosphate N-acetyltransferase